MRERIFIKNSKIMSKYRIRVLESFDELGIKNEKDRFYIQKQVPLLFVFKKWVGIGIEKMNHFGTIYIQSTYFDSFREAESFIIKLNAGIKYDRITDKVLKTFD